MEDGPRHLLELIQAAQPRAALFTTFTFSASHFDSVFVPALRDVGCEDVSVLVDADKAAASARQERSLAAGRVYRVAPVVAPGGGCFHPKLAYLAGVQDDLLAVASGNLTASGQSLQLECFDSIALRHAPGVFEELERWAMRLAALTRNTSPQAALLLQRLAGRVRNVLSRQPQTSDPRPGANATLIHTLSGSPLEALAECFLARADRATRVTVLAPFHAPDGEPVLDLAKKVRASRLKVGLDASRSAPVAPFDRSRFEPKLPVSYVVPDTERANRPLHAKVFELEAADEVLVMTGSVNATHASFASEANIEVSLARWLARSPLRWKKVKPVDFEPTQYSFEGSSRAEFHADASLATDRMLHIQLSSRKQLPRIVEVRLHRGTEEVFEVSHVQLDAQGMAVVRGPGPGFNTTQALLLSVTAPDVEASCWLNMHEEIDSGAEQRKQRSALARLLQGEFSEADLSQVLQALSQAAQGLTTAGATLGRGQERTSDDANEAFHFMRAASGGRRSAGATFLGRNPHDLLHALGRWMSADLGSLPTRGLSGAHGPAQGEPPSDGFGDEGTRSPESGAKPDQPRHASPQELLDRVCVVIGRVLEANAAHELGAVLAEVAASRAAWRSLKEPALRMAPCLAWLDRYGRLAWPEPARVALGAVAAALACLTAHGLERSRQDPQLPLLREYVERLVGCKLDSQRWAELCRAGLEREYYRIVEAAEREPLFALHTRLAAAAGPDDAVLALIRRAAVAPRTLEEVPEAAALPDVARALRERRRPLAELLRGIVIETKLRGAGCPFCYRVLRPDELTTLRQRRALVHACGQLLLLPAYPESFEHSLRDLFANA